MRRCADYDRNYGAPEDAYIPPRHNNGGHPRAPLVVYKLEDDEDTTIDGFAAFTPALGSLSG